MGSNPFLGFGEKPKLENINELLKQEQQQLREQDRQRAGEGYRYRATIWIHPIVGGDDYQIDVYSSDYPTKNILAPYLKDSAPAMRDDYKVYTLCPKCGCTTWLENKTHGTSFCKDCGQRHPEQGTVGMRLGSREGR